MRNFFLLTLVCLLAPNSALSDGPTLGAECVDSMAALARGDLDFFQRIYRPNEGQPNEAIRNSKNRDIGLRMIRANLDPENEIKPFLSLVYDLIQKGDKTNQALLSNLKKRLAKMTDFEMQIFVQRAVESAKREGCFL